MGAVTALSWDDAVYGMEVYLFWVFTAVQDCGVVWPRKLVGISVNSFTME